MGSIEKSRSPIGIRAFSVIGRCIFLNCSVLPDGTARLRLLLHPPFSGARKDALYSRTDPGSWTVHFLRHGLEYRYSSHSCVSCNYVEVSPTTRDLCFVTGSGMSDKSDFPVSSFFSFSSYKNTLIFHGTPSYISFWLLTAARITSASIDFFSICEPRARASVIRLSIRRGFPWEWLWMAERAAFLSWSRFPRHR